MPAGINDAQLRQLAEIALDQIDQGAAYTEDTYDYAAALEWAKGRDAASEPRWHGIALLRPVPGSKETLWRDFDAVTSWVTDEPDPDPRLSHKTWDAIIDHVTPETAIPVGSAAYEAGELEISIKSHRVAADNPDAMYNLGILLEERAGKGDLAEAEQWYRRAADQDYADAMTNLGVLLHERGDAASLAEAEQWYRRAADQGNADAMLNLGKPLSERGDAASLAEAEQWFRRAADQGNAAAMHNLGVLLTSRGDAESLAEAEKWFEQARQRGVEGPH
jgi:hypothetical protein